jgi:cyanophycinase
VDRVKNFVKPSVLAFLAFMIQTSVQAETPSSSKKASGNGYTLYELGSPNITTETKPGFLLAGGGRDIKAAARWMVEKSGGGDFVILRASGGDGYQDYLYKEIGGINSITTIVFSSREAASDPAILDRIAQAEAIFIAGGDQARYYEFWAETPVADAVNKHVRDGKPLGGTSAGYAVLGGYAYSARNDSVVSKEALADPFDDRVTIEKSPFEIPQLAGLFPDTHFTQRERLGRLVAFLARLRSQQPPVSLIGVGIDEGTALCVEGDGTAQVVSMSGGCVNLVKLPEVPQKVESGQPLEIDKVLVRKLEPDSTLHLADLDRAFQGVEPVSVKDGTVNQAGL